jgi:hypothetical protein
VINSRLWHECERGRRRRQIPLDTTAVDDSQDGTAIDIEMSLRREDARTRPDGLFAQREVRAKVFHVLRERANGDATLLAFLDAYEDGHHREGEVTERLNLTENTFYNVVRRFKTLRGHVPVALRADMRDMLIRDGGPAVASVARHRGRVVEVIVDDNTSASNDQFSALDTSSDGGSNDGDNDARNVA